jgi:hypothetical protein
MMHLTVGVCASAVRIIGTWNGGRILPSIVGGSCSVSVTVEPIGPLILSRTLPSESKVWPSIASRI